MTESSYSSRSSISSVGFAESPRDALRGERAQIFGVRREALGERKRREVELSFVEIDGAQLRDRPRVLERLGDFGEERRHLLLRLEVELARGEAEALRIVEVASRLEAEEHFVGLDVRLVEIVDVVRRDERDPRLAGELDQPLFRLDLVLDPVVLELEIEAVLSEEVPQTLRLLPRRLVPFVDDRLRDVAAQTRAQRDETAAVRRERIHVDPRFVVEPLQVADRGEPHEVLVALGCRGRGGPDGGSARARPSSSCGRRGFPA